MTEGMGKQVTVRRPMQDSSVVMMPLTHLRADVRQWT